MRNSYRMIFAAEFAMLPEEEKAKAKGPLTGTSKKTGNPYQFWKLPEPQVFDPLALNKAIKMAQKSAFVDAVIRTTGMSDLFTQDIEDLESTVEVEPEVKKSSPAQEQADRVLAQEAKPFPSHPSVANAPVALPVTQQKAGDPCVICDGTYKFRKGARGSFFGCSNYPKCTSTKDIPQT